MCSYSLFDLLLLHEFVTTLVGEETFLWIIEDGEVDDIYVEEYGERVRQQQRR
jgi:hypothetical protein